MLNTILETIIDFLFGRWIALFGGVIGTQETQEYNAHAE